MRSAALAIIGCAALVCVSITAHAAPSTPVVVALEAPGLFPLFDPAVTDYAAEPDDDGVLPVTVTAGDDAVQLFVQNVPVRSREAQSVWAPSGRVIDVVAFSDRVEVARYRIRALPARGAWQPVAIEDAEREGALLVDEAELIRRFAEGTLDAFVSVDAEAEARRATAEAEADAAELEAYFARMPGAREIFAEGEARGGLDPADERGTRPFEFADRRGVARTVQLMTHERTRAAQARAMRRARSRDNVLALYLRLRDSADGSALFPAGVLPDAAEAARLDVDSLRGLVRAIAAEADTLASSNGPHPSVEPLGSQPFFPELPLARPCVGGRPAEYGGNAGSDMMALSALEISACGLEPGGIIANDTRPYIQTLGCIRDQANRGTCGGFAVVAALEGAFAASSGTLVNLSEQALYARMKLDEPSRPKSEHMWDGIYADEVIARLGEIQFTTSLEHGWPYNPSFARKSIGNAGYFKYADSCVGYGANCSDAPHQARRVCTRETFELLGRLSRKCGWETQRSPWGVRLWTQSIDLWDETDTHAAVGAMKLALDEGAHIALWMRVTSAFYDGVQSDGFVIYHGENQSWYGGHVLDVVGYIDNSLLDEVAPGSPHGDYAKPGYKGEGGYMIARNSWGPCSGDGGYVYLPYRWLKPSGHVFSANAIYPDDVVWWQTK